MSPSFQTVRHSCHVGGAAFSYPAIRHDMGPEQGMSLGFVLSEAIKVAIFLAKVTRRPYNERHFRPQSLT